MKNKIVPGKACSVTPGTLCRFPTGVTVESEKWIMFEPPGVILMYVETTKRSRSYWYDHKFLNPEGEIVLLSSLNGEKVFSEMEILTI